MTVAELVDMIFEEVRAGHLRMGNEVPERMLIGELLPRMDVAQYLKDRGVDKIGNSQDRK